MKGQPRTTYRQVRADRDCEAAADLSVFRGCRAGIPGLS